MKKFLFLGACLVALASQPAMAQTGEPDVVVMTVYRTGMRGGHIVISRGPNNSEEIEFADNKPNTSTEAMQVAISKLYQQGYRLRSTLSASTGVLPYLIFTKE